MPGSSRWAEASGLAGVVVLSILAIGVWQSPTAAPASPPAPPASEHPQAGPSPEGNSFGSSGASYANEIATTLHRTGHPGTPVQVPPSPVGEDIGDVGVGRGPVDLAYNAQSGLFYIANYRSDNVTVLNGTSDQVATSINLSGAPEAITFDPANGQVYVAVNLNSTVGSVVEIDGSSNRVIAHGSTPASVSDLVADPQNGEIYATDYSSNRVLVINASNVSVVGSVGVGRGPMGIALDPSNGDLYVANLNSSNVSVLSTRNLSRVTDIGVGTSPEMIVYENATGDLYVTDQANGSGEVTVIDSSTDGVVSELSVGGVAYGVAYDPARESLYVSNLENGSLVGFNASTGARIGQLAIGAECVALAYDPLDGYVLAPDYGDRDVVLVAPTFLVVFNETGLPGNTGWSVNVDGANSGSSVDGSEPFSTIDFYEPSGTHSFAVSPPTDYAAQPSSGTLTVNGTEENVGIVMTDQGTIEGIISPPSNDGNYPVVYVDGTTEPVLATGEYATAVPAEAFPYNVTVSLLGYRSASRGVVVTPANVTWANFTLVPVTAPSLFTVTFSEIGLPGGMNWSVSLDGVRHQSAGTSINFSEPNGTYPYELGEVPGWTTPEFSGSITVAGSDLSVASDWNMSTYVVTVSETGLPRGTEWSVTLDGTLRVSDSATASFTEPNGTYPYTLDAVPGWTTARFSGEVTLSGMPVAQSVARVEVTYPVVFAEEGLPAGTDWSVQFHGDSQSAVGSISFPGVPNGSYPYSVGAVGDYETPSPSGTVQVHGTSQIVNVSFIPPITSCCAHSTPQAPSKTLLGLPLPEAYLLIGGLAAAALVAALARVVLRRRKKVGPPERVLSG